MQYKTLGNTGLIVSDLTLGTMTFGESSSRSTPEKESITQIDTFLDAGGNHIDTANVYAGGVSEEIVGKALKKKRKQAVVATKVRFPMGDGQNQQGLSRWAIIEEVENSLKRLDTDYIDLLYMHAWDPLTSVYESLSAFDNLVHTGKVRYIGVSNFKAWQLMKALSISDARNLHRFCVAQYQYSLVKRDIEYEFVDLFQSEGLSLMPWGPLGGGFLSGKYSPDHLPTKGRIADTSDQTEESWERRNTQKNWEILRVVDKIAKNHSATHAQVSISWLRQKPYVGSVILGARTTDQLVQNLKAAEITLAPDEVELLDEVSHLPELYPYRFLEAYAQRSA